MDTKFLSLGFLLLAIGTLLVFGFFFYPEIFAWVGLGGILAVLSPFIAIFLGIGLIYAGVSRAEMPPPAPKTDFHVDERIDIEGARYVEKETTIIKQHLDLGEKLRAVFEGEVDGKPELDRLALTDKRILFYSANNALQPVKLQYGQIESVDAKKGKVLQHLGEVNLLAEGKSIRFKNLLQEDLHQVLNTITSQTKTARVRTAEASRPRSETKFCPNCGKPVEHKDKFCRECGIPLER